MKRLLCLLMLALSLQCLQAKADIYSYVDKNGTLRLTNLPRQTGYVLWLKEPHRVAPDLASKPSEIHHQLQMSDSTPYIQHVNAAAQKFGVDRRLLHALIMVESGYDPDAISPKGACGLMQLMPLTARRYGVNNIFDPNQNLMAGTHYLSDLLKLFNNKPELALAAYNAGENNVLKAGSNLPPYAETRDYVTKVIALYNDIKRNNAVN